MKTRKNIGLSSAMLLACMLKQAKTAGKLAVNLVTKIGTDVVEQVAFGVCIIYINCCIYCQSSNFVSTKCCIGAC